MSSREPLTQQLASAACVVGRTKNDEQTGHSNFQVGRALPFSEAQSKAVVIARNHSTQSRLQRDNITVLLPQSSSNVSSILQLLLCIMPLVNLNHLAVLSVITLISGLSYGSQALFEHLQPGPLPFDQWWRFNALIACIWVSYFRACFTDPGWVPRGYAKADELKAPESIQSNVHICRKCNAFKPPRAHHCKICSK